MFQLNRVDTEAFRKMDKIPVEIVLDNVRSALNVGSVFRTCDAFGIKKLHLCGITAVPPHREILKTALGADKSVDWQHWNDTDGALQFLKNEGYALAGIEQIENSVSLEAFNWKASPKIVLVFGNEVEGISASVLDMLDVAIEIPQVGTKHSINVSVCAGIVIWEAFRANFPQL